MSDNNELAVKQAPFKIGQKLTGLAAKKASAETAQNLSLSEEEKAALLDDPTKAEHRIGIVFDDSGSMSAEQIADAKEGCEEFLRSCVSETTAVCCYPMNATGFKLTKNLPAMGMLIKNMIPVYGGTPLVAVTEKMLSENSVNRAIVFSDGQPNSINIDCLLRREVKIDTVYISSGYLDRVAIEFLKNLAEKTGGIYLQFERGKSNFRTAFKYLSPGLRHMLADKSFVAKLEGR